jgi:hypothetical protein
MHRTGTAGEGTDRPSPFLIIGGTDSVTESPWRETVSLPLGDRDERDGRPETTGKPDRAAAMPTGDNPGDVGP